MYSHPNNHVNTGEEKATAAFSSPSPNPTNNNPMPTSWLPDEGDPDSSPIPNTELDSDHSTPASSPPSLLSTFNSSHKSPESEHKQGKQPSEFPPTNPFSSAYKPPVQTSTPRPRPSCTNPFPSPAATPTPPPRSARSSELLSARIASYEARALEAAARATARAATRASTGASPPLDKPINSSASSVSENFHHVVTQKSPAPPSHSVDKPDRMQEPHIASHKTLPTPSCVLEASPPSLNRGKAGRSSSVSSQMSPFANFYVAATENFPTLPNDGAFGPDHPKQDRVSSGLGGRRIGIVLDGLKGEVVRGKENQYAVEDDEEEEWEKEEDGESRSCSPSPVSRFQTGGDDDMTAFSVGASSSNRGNSRLLDSRSSCVSAAPSCPDLSDAQSDEGARLYWEDVKSELDEVANEVVLADDENDPSYPRVNSAFSRSTIPAGNEHSEKFSKRKPGREEVLQVHLNSFPKYEVSGVFFDQINQTKRMNEEAKRRATCIDDYDADPTPLPTCVEYENITLPLHERLSNMLPSPSIFTPSLVPDPFTVGTYEYRPRDHGLRAIEMASTAPDLELKDESLRARAAQYTENRELVERALKEDGILRGIPNVVHAFECQHCHNVKVLRNISDGPQSSDDIDTLKSLILAQHELRQDIERLEATERGVQVSFSTLGSLPIRHRFGNAKQRQRLVDKIEQGRQERRRQALSDHVQRERHDRAMGTADELSSVPVDKFGHELYQALNALEPIVEHPSDPHNRSITTTNLVSGEYFPLVDQAGPHRPTTRRSSSVYSERPVRVKSGATTSHAVLGELEFTGSGETPNLLQSGAQDRAAAYRIMKSVQTYHNSRRTSRASIGSGPMDGESARTGRTKERRR